MNEILAQTVKEIFTPKKGILASDERPSSADKNLAKVGIQGSPEIRRKYRELFINTPDFERYVSGMILSDETFWQKDSNEKSFVETLVEKKIVPIIKVDDSVAPFPFSEDEDLTKGIDGLNEKLANYFENGARAAKWRAVFKIGEKTPTKQAIEANATLLALYSLYCHKNNIVPIVEPEVIYRGTHSFEQAKKVTAQVLQMVFGKLQNYKVDLPNVILKSSMVLPGRESPENSTVTSKEIAKATIDVFKASVPNEVAGIVFLSGGQDPTQATQNLNKIAKTNDTHWPMTFSFLRAIEAPAAETWKGKEENVEKAREVFLKKLELDSKAMQGLL